MAPITDVSHRSANEEFSREIILMGLGFLVVATFVSGFLAPLQSLHLHPVPARLLFLLQKVDRKLFLVPLALHPWKALGLAILLGYALPLYGLARNRFWDKNSRFNALCLAPVFSACIGLALFFIAQWREWTDYENLRYYSWLALSGLLSVLADAGYTWFFALKHGPRSLEDLHHNPHLYEVEDLSGTAMARELTRGERPLLLRFWGTDWPNPENSNVRRKLAGRLVIGRFYERHVKTNYWVCPEIGNLQQTLVVAPPGAGKTHSIALPWSRELPVQGQSAFVIDVKGDMASALRSFFERRGTPLYSFNPEDPGSLLWNPFDEIERSDPSEMYNGADRIARAIFGEISSHDKYWDLSELGYLRAAVELLIRTNPNPTPSDLADLLRTKERLIATLSQLTARMDAEPQGFTPEDRRAAEEIERGLQLLVSEAEQKRTGYYERIQGAFIKFALFNNQRISRITQSSPFRLNRLTERPSTMVFAAPLSLGLDSSTLAAIAVRLLQQLIYARFTEHHQRKLFFILDEFSKLQLSAKEMEHFVSTSRSAGCVTVVILQSVDQIDPRARAELLDNLADRYILHGAGPATAMWFERTFHDRVATRATASEQRTSSSRHTAAGSGTSLTETTVPVLAAREIHNTGGLQYGAWLRLARYSSKPILADLERRN